MKFIILIGILAWVANAQSLSPEQQKKLIEENNELKEEVKFLKAEVLKAKSQSPAVPQDTSKMMEALVRGKKFQEEQNKALEELDKED